jgi:hypothetical protein
LGIGLACAITALMGYEYNASFDAIHPNAQEIYRVNGVRLVQQEQQSWTMMPLPLATQLASDLPNEVQAYVRVGTQWVDVSNRKAAFGERAMFADPALFDLFNFEFALGGPQALANPAQVVLGQRAAKKLFGSADPLGQPLKIKLNDSTLIDVEVGAVLAPLPSNNTFDPDYLLAYHHWEQPRREAGWGQTANYVFLHLPKPGAPAKVAQQLNRYLAQQRSANASLQYESFYLDPFAGLAQRDTRDNVRGYSLAVALPQVAMAAPALIAGLLLLAACFNFMNTSIATAHQRLTEISLRKVMGGQRGQLVAQLMGENLLVCSLALVGGLALNELFVPAFGELFYIDLRHSTVSYPRLVAQVGGVVLGCAGLAGAYPALYLSSFQPAQIFGGAFHFGGNGWLAQGLVLLQLSISALAITASLACLQNARYLAGLDLGYDQRDNLTVVELDDARRYEVLKNALRARPEVVRVAGSLSHVGYSSTTRKMKAGGQEGEAVVFGVGENYLSTLGLRLVEGRDFDHRSATDAQSAVVVNQSLVKQFGWTQPLGQVLTVDTAKVTVVGVVEDFVARGLWHPVEPTVLKLMPPDRYQYLLVQVAPGRRASTDAWLAAEWAKVAPNVPFLRFSQAEVMAKEKQLNGSIRTVFTFMGLVALFLSLNGLLGMVSLNLLKRLREIGIRKVFGANMWQLSRLIGQRVVAIIGVALVVGSLLAYLGINLVLGSIFAYYQSPSGGTLAAGGLLLLVAGAGTAATKIVRAALANPSEVLRAK